MELAAIRVRIGLRGGHHAFPDFGSLGSVQSCPECTDWSIHVDRMGLGWHYDSCCGHDKDTPASPFGTWLGLLLVPQQFAVEAVAAFPTEVARLNEGQLTTFWNTHVASGQQDTIDNTEVLQAIAAKRALGIPETQSDRDALDPASPTSGVVENPRKTWARYKAHTGTTITTR